MVEPTQQGTQPGGEPASQEPATGDKEGGYKRVKRQRDAARAELTSLNQRIAGLESTLQSFMQGQQAGQQPVQASQKRNEFTPEELESMALSDDASQQAAAHALTKAYQQRLGSLKSDFEGLVESKIQEYETKAQERAQAQQIEAAKQNAAKSQITKLFGPDALKPDNPVFEEAAALEQEYLQRYKQLPPPEAWLSLYTEAASNLGKLPGAQAPEQQQQEGTPPPPGGGIEGVGSGAADQSAIFQSAIEKGDRKAALKDLASRMFIEQQR